MLAQPGDAQVPHMLDSRHRVKATAVVERINGGRIVPMKVDLTSGHNDAGNALLARLDRREIPLLVIFRSDRRPYFKSDFYTVKQAVKALGSVATSRTAPRDGRTT